MRGKLIIILSLMLGVSMLAGIAGCRKSSKNDLAMNRRKASQHTNRPAEVLADTVYRPQKSRTLPEPIKIEKTPEATSNTVYIQPEVLMAKINYPQINTQKIEVNKQVAIKNTAMFIPLPDLEPEKGFITYSRVADRPVAEVMQNKNNNKALAKINIKENMNNKKILEVNKALEPIVARPSINEKQITAKESENLGRTWVSTPKTAWKK